MFSSRQIGLMLAFSVTILGQSNSPNERAAEEQALRAQVARGCMAESRIGSIVMQARAAGQREEADRILYECVQARMMIHKIKNSCRTNSYVSGLLQQAPKAEEQSILDDCVQATYSCEMNKTVMAEYRQARAASRITEANTILDTCITNETKKRRR